MIAPLWCCACTGPQHEDPLCPAGIVAEMAKRDPPSDLEYGCNYCEGRQGWKAEIEAHEETCLWRRAVESAKRNGDAP